MIRKCCESDLDMILEIWLDCNRRAHSFIDSSYWEEHVRPVRDMISRATVFIFEDKGRINGFIGLMDGTIAGLFVRWDRQSRGIGQQLLSFVKKQYDTLLLQVYQMNKRAVKFYLREGFIVQKEQIDEATGKKEYVMVWKR